MDDQINRVHWLPDGNEALVVLDSGFVDILDFKTSDIRRRVKIRDMQGIGVFVRDAVPCFKPHLMMVLSDRGEVFLVDNRTGRQLTRAHQAGRPQLLASPDGNLVLLCDAAGLTLFDEEGAREEVVTLGGPFRGALDPDTVSWAPGGSKIFVCDEGGQGGIYSLRERRFIKWFRGHPKTALRSAWSADGERIAVGGRDGTISVLDSTSGRLLYRLEGHTAPVIGVSFSRDGRLLATHDMQDGLLLWDAHSFQLLCILEHPIGRFRDVRTRSLAFHPGRPVLATPFVYQIQLWLLEDLSCVSGPGIASALYYTNAKVVLVGDSGVGKTCLGNALMGQSFEYVQPGSTHGRQVWVLDAGEHASGSAGRELREVLLWDLAGQPGYRLIHQLHLHEVAVAVLVCDAKSETDPLAGVRYWDRALEQAMRLQGKDAVPLQKILVAARVDRGGLAVSRKRIDEWLQEFSYKSFVETSARSNQGIPELKGAILDSIDWDRLPKVSSPGFFQSMKDYLVEQTGHGRLLSTREELYNGFLIKNKAFEQSPALEQQFDACIRLVEARGIVRRLSFGGFILLRPEVLDAYASALIHAARDEPDGLGSILETEAQTGRFKLAEDDRVADKRQEELLLLATIEDLFRHELVLKEPTDHGQLLVFPSQFTRDYPDAPDPPGRTLTIKFEGAVLNVYTTLIVRLSRTGVFKKSQMWKNAAVFESGKTTAFGIYLRETNEGAGEISVFFQGPFGPDLMRYIEDYVTQHVGRKSVTDKVQVVRAVVCPSCKTPVTDLQAERRRERGFTSIICSVCEASVPLEATQPVAFNVDKLVEMNRSADMQRDRESDLLSAKAEMRTPSFLKWAGAEQATIAVVFTDICDSTALNHDVGNEAMMGIRNAHFERGQGIATKLDGYVVKTIGDSLMVAFRTASKALDFCVDLVRDPGHRRIHIRAGLHIGPVDIQGEDIFGNMVNYASRVESHAPKGEIAVSVAAKAHIDQEKARRHREFTWKRTGPVVFKGLKEEQTVWLVSLVGNPGSSVSVVRPGGR